MWRWSEKEQMAAVAPSRHQMAAEVFTWHPAAWAIWPALNLHGQNFIKTQARAWGKNYWEVIFTGLQNSLYILKYIYIF